MKHVIIGNGPAGWTAAKTIREHAPCDEILLIGAEGGPPYSRMAIPRLLSGSSSDQEIYLCKDAGHLSRLRIQQKKGWVRRVDGEFRSLLMDDGRRIGFDKLLIATGSRAMMPVIPGIDCPGVHACWTLEDARNIMRLARPGTRVVLIGAGFIGCTLIGALIARGVQLAVVEKKDHVLPNMMSRGGAEIIKAWCEQKGVRVYTSCDVEQIFAYTPQHLSTRNASVIAQLSNGQQLCADLIITATGARPNVRFLRNSGIRCRYGVLVNASMETNVAGIYAAGDCAEAFNATTGQHMISAVHANAVEQAYCAALNMTGRHAMQDRVREVDVLTTLGLTSASLGQWRGVLAGQWTELRDVRNFKYLRLEFFGDILVGANVIGLAEHASILRSLIQEQVRLGKWKDLLLKNPALLKEAHSAVMRRQNRQRIPASYSAQATI